MQDTNATLDGQPLYATVREGGQNPDGSLSWSGTVSSSTRLPIIDRVEYVGPLESADGRTRMVRGTVLLVHRGLSITTAGDEYTCEIVGDGEPIDAA